MWTVTFRVLTNRLMLRGRMFLILNVMALTCLPPEWGLRTWTLLTLFTPSSLLATACLRVLRPLTLTPTSYLVVILVVMIRVIGRAFVLNCVGGLTHRVLRLT